MTYRLLVWDTEFNRWSPTGATFDSYEHAVSHMVKLQNCGFWKLAVVRRLEDGKHQFLKTVKCAA